MKRLAPADNSKCPTDPDTVPGQQVSGPAARKPNSSLTYILDSWKFSAKISSGTVELHSTRDLCTACKVAAKWFSHVTSIYRCSYDAALYFVPPCVHGRRVDPKGRYFTPNPSSPGSVDWRMFKNVSSIVCYLLKSGL